MNYSWKEIFSFTWKQVIIGTLIAIGVISFIIAASCVAYGADPTVTTCKVKLASTTDTLNVRDTPSTKSWIIGRIINGTEVSIIDLRHKKKPWVFVSFSFAGQIDIPIGWVHARYLTDCIQEPLNKRGG